MFWLAGTPGCTLEPLKAHHQTGLLGERMVNPAASICATHFGPNIPSWWTSHCDFGNLQLSLQTFPTTQQNHSGKTHATWLCLKKGYAVYAMVCRMLSLIMWQTQQWTITTIPNWIYEIGSTDFIGGWLWPPALHIKPLGSLRSATYLGNVALSVSQCGISR